MLDATIVIRCGNDDRVFRCLESIDSPAEVVVAFTGDKELSERIAKAGARCVPAPPANLSRVSNAGIDAASTDYVILTDSDTVFEPGCIERLRLALQSRKAARARLRFENGRGLSRIVAEARDYVNSLPLLYTPGIALRRDLLQDVGGFFFNDPVPFAVDADLNFRVQRANVQVAFLSDAWVRHTAIPLPQDLRAARRIGAGCKESMQYWNRSGAFGPVNRLTLKGVKPTLWPDLLRTKGPSVLGYQLLWDASYWLGFFGLGTLP
jgi:GT2 family glycosyltransferase